MIKHVLHYVQECRVCFATFHSLNALVKESSRFHTKIFALSDNCKTNTILVLQQRLGELVFPTTTHDMMFRGLLSGSTAKRQAIAAGSVLTASALFTKIKSSTKKVDADEIMAKVVVVNPSDTTTTSSSNTTKCDVFAAQPSWVEHEALKKKSPSNSNSNSSSSV